MAANKVVSDLYLIYFWLRVTYFHIKTASGVYVWFQNIDSQIMGMFKKKERKKKGVHCLDFCVHMRYANAELSSHQSMRNLLFIDSSCS